MTPLEFNVIADLARRRAGLVFTEDKSYFVESRVAPLLRRRAMASPSDLITALRGDDALAAEVVDALVNSETSFFRDKSPFSLLRDQVLPALLAQGRGESIRIWSAACATGQEPYSVAMTIDRAISAGGPAIDILATDVSASCVKAAREGRYTEFEMRRGVSPLDRTHFFEPDGSAWRVRAALRGKLRCRTFNLLDDPSELGVFDVVFCRNVLIYFDTPTRRRVLGNIAKVMPQGGYLFVGASETMFAFTDLFAPMPGAPGVYRPAARRAAA